MHSQRRLDIRKTLKTIGKTGCFAVFKEKLEETVGSFLEYLQRILHFVNLGQALQQVAGFPFPNLRAPMWDVVIIY